jgi:hypothetical protein
VDVGADDRRQKLLRRLVGPLRPEVTCDECFEFLDWYVELELAGVDADRRLPGMREHLQGCSACDEEYESLRDFVRLEDHGGNA